MTYVTFAVGTASDPTTGTTSTKMYIINSRQAAVLACTLKTQAVIRGRGELISKAESNGSGHCSRIIYGNYKLSSGSNSVNGSSGIHSVGMPLL
jgi:hypothetical protein